MAYRPQEIVPPEGGRELPLRGLILPWTAEIFHVTPQQAQPRRSKSRAQRNHDGDDQPKARAKETAACGWRI
jgi:hypothetical protein